MKRFMTSTAIALLIGTSAVADGHLAMFSDTPYDAAVNLTASDLLGARLYATESDLGAMTSMTADQATEWDDIGEINEIILTRDGAVQSVIVGVGGFLGMGEKDVSVDMANLKFVSDGDDADDYFVVINSNLAGLTDAPMYHRTQMMDEGMAEEEVAGTDNILDDKPGFLMAPTIDRDGYKATMIDDLTAEDLTGARVYGASDEDVGEISELLLTADGKLDRAVIDVGGFLGMGEHPVAVTFDELTIIRADDGSNVRVYIDSSQEALEGKPAYEG